MFPIQGAELEFRNFAWGRKTRSSLNWVISAGSFVAIVGESGSGKSTWLRRLIQCRKPGVFVDGVETWKQPSALRQRLGYVAQETTIHGSLSAKAILAHSLRFRATSHVPRTKVDEVIRRKLYELGLAKNEASLQAVAIRPAGREVGVSDGVCNLPQRS